MSIQRSPFPLVLDANDFQRTDRGVKWGIKFHEIIGFGQAVYLVYPSSVDGTQKVETLDDAFDIHILQDHGGDVLNWIKNRIIPKLNAWLAKMFPPISSDGEWTPAPPDATKFEEAWLAVAKIKFTTAADGTIKASV
jgi:hypothetical protein